MPRSRPLSWTVTPRGCHECTSHTRNKRGGYPRANRGGRRVLLSHFVFEREYGPVPPGMRVLHLCDNPACINPDHLFLGTQRDNLLDMGAKGRWRKPNDQRPLQCRGEHGQLEWELV